MFCTRVPNTSHHHRRTRGATRQQRRHPTTRSSAPRHRGQKRPTASTSGQPNARLQQTPRTTRYDCSGTKRHHRRTVPIPCHLHHECEEKGITIRTPGLEGNLTMWLDADKLEKIFNNLMSNAMKFTPWRCHRCRLRHAGQWAPHLTQHC